MENKDKPSIRTGDLVVNETAKCTFLITKCFRENIELLMLDYQTKNSKTFKMSKTRFLEQLTGDRGVHELKYFPVKISK